MPFFTWLFKKNVKTKNDHHKMNPAFDYIQKQYKIDCSVYKNLSSIIYNNATDAANEFAKLINKKKHDDLIHFFFDYLLSFYVSGAVDSFYKENKDLYSALVDGIHIEYYGNVSDQIIASTLQLWTAKDRCFLKTDFNLVMDKENIGDNKLLITTIALNCARNESPSATEVLSISTTLFTILFSKLDKIQFAFKDISKN